MDDRDSINYIYSWAKLWKSVILRQGDNQKEDEEEETREQKGEMKGGQTLMSEYSGVKVFYVTGIKEIHQALLFKSEKHIKK